MNEYRLIRELEKNPCQTQRTIAQRLNISVGKANYLLSGLVEKGLIKARKLKNQPGQIRWNYLLTPKGLQEKVRMTRDYLCTRMAQYEEIRQEIEELRREVDTASG